MEIMGIASISSITVICYLAAELCKALGLEGKWLPAICGILGALLGVAAMFVMPDFPAGDIITALAVGIVSGLAATGANELVKQLSAK